MKKEGNMVYSLIENAGLLKKNLSELYTVLSMTILFYVSYTLYILNRKISNFKESAYESITAVADTYSVRLSQDLKKENLTLIETHLQKLNTLQKSITANQDLLLQKSSAKTDALLIKLLDAQVALSQTFAKPAVTVVQESGAKPVVIGVLIGLVLVIGTGLYVVPKVSVLSISAFTQLQWYLSQTLKYIPGSNSAYSTEHVHGHPYYKIITHITKGVAEHVVFDTRDGSEEKLGIFIKKLVDHALSTSSSDTSLVETAMKVVTKSGDLVDISGLL